MEAGQWLVPRGERLTAQIDLTLKFAGIACFFLSDCEASRARLGRVGICMGIYVFM